MNTHYAHCANCQRYQPKQSMRPIYTAHTSSMPPKILCYLCENCYWGLLDYLGVEDVCKFTYRRPPEGEEAAMQVYAGRETDGG